MTVTVIIATYNRPDTLTTALLSLQRQIFGDWQALVLGDCCGPETGAAVSAIGDARIRYINLSQRSGEQSGPNSVGLRLAETPLIAFLNHDDIWLPDHLERAVAALNTDAALDMVFSRSVFAFARANDVEGGRPLFQDISPEGRTLFDVFHSALWLFEPASSWVFRKSVAERVGDWRHSSGLFRTPSEDWLLRCARAGVKSLYSDLVTALKVTTHAHAPLTMNQYDFGARDQRYMLDMIAARGAEGVRAHIANDLATCASLGAPPRDPHKRRIDGEEAQWLRERLLTPALREVFFRTGWDALDVLYTLAGYERGAIMRETRQRRTGDDIEAPPTIDALMQALQRD